MNFAPFKKMQHRLMLLFVGIWLSSVSINARAQPGGIDPSLVDLYAPQFIHPGDEPNLPTNVDAFLPNTSLMFHDGSCPQDQKDFGQTSLDLLTTASVTSACNGHKFMASGTRSADRSKTFVISDVPDQNKRGSTDPTQWKTYYHSYQNASGGWTIQYWSFYAFNTGIRVGPFELGDHGGDWEMVSVVLGAGNAPLELRATGHSDLESVAWNGVAKNGTHPIVYTERGGHEAHATAQQPPPFILHQTWSGGMVFIPGQPPSSAGPLVNLGSKLAPNVAFLLYSGLWGSIGATPISSGYWGPVFNETGMKADGFLAAWCDGIRDPSLSSQNRRECYPDDIQ
jgi:hypothetical protein